MATVQIITYTCDNCSKTLDEANPAQHFEIIYGGERNKIDLCADCAVKVAWLHAKGERVTARNNARTPAPAVPTGRKRGRPRKNAIPAIGTGTDTPLPGNVVENARVVTLGEMFGEAGEIVAADDGMGGDPAMEPTPPTVTSVPVAQHPAFQAVVTP